MEFYTPHFWYVHSYRINYLKLTENEHFISISYSLNNSYSQWVYFPHCIQTWKFIIINCLNDQSSHLINTKHCTSVRTSYWELVKQYSLRLILTVKNVINGDGANWVTWYLTLKWTIDNLLLPRDKKYTREIWFYYSLNVLRTESWICKPSVSKCNNHWV